MIFETHCLVSKVYREFEGGRAELHRQFNEAMCEARRTIRKIYEEKYKKHDSNLYK